MKRYLITWNVLLACGSILLGLASPPLSGQGSKQSLPKKQSAATPTQGEIWKSETTGKEYRVRIEKDRFYAEWANIPPEGMRQGVYIRTECRRVGEKWVGTSEVLLQCPLPPGAPNGKAMNSCRMTLRFEVDLIARDRISGHADSLRNFDCAKCEIHQTGWGSFVWVPKRKAVRAVGSTTGKLSDKQ